VDFLFVSIYFFSARCQGWGAYKRISTGNRRFWREWVSPPIFYIFSPVAPQT